MRCPATAGVPGVGLAEHADEGPRTVASAKARGRVLSLDTAFKKAHHLDLLPGLRWVHAVAHATRLREDEVPDRAREGQLAVRRVGALVVVGARDRLSARWE